MPRKPQEWPHAVPQVKPLGDVLCHSLSILGRVLHFEIMDILKNVKTYVYHQEIISYNNTTTIKKLCEICLVCKLKYCHPVQFCPILSCTISW